MQTVVTLGTLMIKNLFSDIVFFLKKQLPLGVANDSKWFQL